HGADDVRERLAARAASNHLREPFGRFTGHRRVESRDELTPPFGESGCGDPLCVVARGVYPYVGESLRGRVDLVADAHAPLPLPAARRSARSFIDSASMNSSRSPSSTWGSL